MACCVSGGAVAEAGGGVLAHGRRLQAALLRPSSSSLLFRHCFFSLFPLLLLSTTFFSLYGGIMEVLVLLEAGGGVLAHGRRLQAAAAVLLFQCFPMILPVCFLQVFNSSFLSLCFGLSFSLSVFLFSLPSSSVFLFLPFRFLLSGLSPPPFSPLSRCLSQRSWVLFIEPRAWLFTVLMGSSRLVGH